MKEKNSKEYLPIADWTPERRRRVEFARLSDMEQFTGGWASK